MVYEVEEMSKKLDQDNLINAIKGDPILRACIQCEHYQKHWFVDAVCTYRTKLKYHPVTGKKNFDGRHI